MATGDLDGDGAVDILMGASLLFDRGGLVFGGRPEFNDTLPIAGDDVLIADVSGDGLLDVVFGARQQGIVVYRNQGGAFFDPPATYPGASEPVNPIAIAGGDLDRDGDLDLVSTAGGGQTFINQGDGSYALPGPPIYGATRLSDAAVADFNGDAILDVVFAGGKDPGGFTPSRVFLGDGQGSFTPDLTLNPAGNISSAVAAGDLTGDGIPEIVLVNKLFPAGVIPNFDEPGLTLVYNYAGQSPTTPIAELNPQVAGTSVALGDLDGDGDHDVVVGAEPASTFQNPGVPAGIAPSVFFRNSGPGAFGAAEAVNPAGAQTLAVAVADLDGDQALDVVLSNRIQGIQRSTGHLNTAPYTLGGSFFELGERANYSKLVAADLTGDGLRDLVYSDVRTGIGYVTNSGNGQGLPTSANRTGDFQVGDMNGDGHLDLVVDQGASFGLLVNNGVGGLSPGGSVTPAAPGGKRYVGDFTGDGPLDVALIADAQIYLYVNDGGGNFTLGPVSQAVAPAAVAVGDVDGDRALDLVLATGTTFTTYVNHGRKDLQGQAGFAPVSWREQGEAEPRRIGYGRAPGGAPIRGLALGDLNGDRMLDVVAVTSTFNYAFFSELGGDDLQRPGELKLAGAPLKAQAQNTEAAAIGDLNGDGALDLVTASFKAQGFQLVNTSVDAYLNDGRGGLELADSRELRTLPLLTSIGAAERLALGDVTADGLDDILVAGPDATATVFRSRRPSVTGIVDTPPTVVVGAPSRTRLAEGYTSPERLAGVVAIPFTLIDPEGDRVSRVIGEYSLDGGGSWARPLDPFPVPAERLNLAASPQGVRHTFFWDLSGLTPVFGQSDTVRFRITAVHTPRPRTGPFSPAQRAPSVAGPLQYAGQQGVSPLFRVRGLIPRVVSAVNPGGEEDALVYRIEYNPSNPTPRGVPLTRAGSTQPLGSDAQGYVPAWGPLFDDDQLIAVLPVSTTGRLTYAFTSAAPTPAGLDAHAVNDALGVSTLTVSRENPLLLLNLTISLEWEASADRGYMEQLKANLLRTSQMLYDWSDGQIALGAVKLYTQRDLWEQADVQIYASNSLRPNATQGGVEPAERTVVYNVDGRASSVTYEPGQIRMGATWSGEGDPGRDSGEDWARALAHELGHYFFYLDETYIGREGDLLVPVEGCLSPMSDPYVDSASEFRPASAWAGACLNTLQHRTTGLSEWALIRRNYDRPGIAPGWDFALNEPASLNANPGPANLPILVTTFEELTLTGPGAFRKTGTTATYSLIRDDGQRYEPSPSARAFIFQIGDFVQGGPTELLDLGAPGSSQVLARGLYTIEPLCVFDPEQELVGCKGPSGDVRLRSFPGWRPELRVTPVTSSGPTGTTTTTLLLEVPAATVAPAGAALPPRLGAWLYPRDLTAEERAALSYVQFGELTLEGSGPAAVYRGAFSDLPALVEEGYIRLFVPDDSIFVSPDGSRPEAVSDFAIGGQPAPKKKPPRRSRRRAPAVSPDGQATLFSEDTSFAPGQFYTLQTVSSLPQPPPWATVVSQGYRLIASDPALLASPDRPLALSLGYAEGAVPPGLEGNVRAIFNDGTGWRELPTRLNTGRNEAAVTVQDRPGVYALVTSLRLRLTRDGWNLIFAYPGGDQELPEALASAGAGYSLVYGFDESDPDEPWRVFAPGLPAQWQPVVNDLGALASGESYWIYATRAITVPLRAVDDRQPLTAAQRATTLATGSVLDQPPATYYGALPDVPPSAPLTVEARVGDALCGSTLTSPHTIDGQLQAAFSLKVTSATPDAPACGRQGELVTLELRQGDTVLNTASVRWDNTRASQVRFGQTTPFGLVFLPFTALRARGGVAEGPDLRVAGIEVVPAAPTAGQPAELRITITNQGSAAVARSFWVDLYVDPDEPPAGGQPWTALSEFGVSWRIYRLEPGETLVLSSLRPDDPLNPGQSYSNFKGFGAATTYRLYAQVDSYGVDGDPEGVIPEEDEANNVFGPLSVRVRP